MSGLRFFLAPETLRAAQSELTAQALSGLKDRAGEVANDLGMEVKQMKQITVGNANEAFDGPHPMMMARGAMASKMEIAAPEAQAGGSTISLQVSAEVVLGDRGR
jgi:predicted secreted protein